MLNDEGFVVFGNASEPSDKNLERCSAKTALNCPRIRPLQSREHR